MPLAGGSAESPGLGGSAEGAGEEPERVPREPLSLGEGPGQLPQLQAAGAAERPGAQPAPPRLPVQPGGQGAAEHHPGAAGAGSRRAGGLLRPLHLHHAAGAGQDPRGVPARVPDLHPGPAPGPAQDRHGQPGQVLGSAAVTPEPASEVPHCALGAGTGRVRRPARGAESLARRHAAGARDQGSLPICCLLPGPSADDAPKPDQRLRDDRSQGFLPSPGLRLHAQQLAATQPAGAAAAALPAPEGAGVRREARGGPAHLLPFLPLAGHAELPPRHEEGALDLPEPVPEPGPAELRRLAAALHQAPLPVQFASEPPAGVLGQQQQEGAAVAAGDGSLLQSDKRGAGGERDQWRPGCGRLRCRLQGAAAQDAGPGLPLAAAAARPPGLRGRIPPARRPDTRLLPGLLLCLASPLLGRPAGLAARLAHGLARLPRGAQVAGAEPARPGLRGSRRAAAAAGAALGRERRGGPVRVPAVLVPAVPALQRPALARRVAPVPCPRVAAARGRVCAGAAAVPGAELPAAAAGGAGGRTAPRLGPLGRLLQWGRVLGLRAGAARQPHLLLLGLPAQHDRGRHELGAGRDFGTLTRWRCQCCCRGAVLGTGTAPRCTWGLWAEMG